MSAASSARDARRSSEAARRSANHVRRLSNELIRERRRSNKLLQQFPAVAQLGYRAGRVEGRDELLEQQASHGRHISWGDGYQGSGPPPHGDGPQRPPPVHGGMHGYGPGRQGPPPAQRPPQVHSGIHSYPPSPRGPPTPQRSNVPGPGGMRGYGSDPRGRPPPPRPNASRPSSTHGYGPGPRAPPPPRPNGPGAGGRNQSGRYSQMPPGMQPRQWQGYAETVYGSEDERVPSRALGPPCRR
ncbi:MAG: hypothetical protein Q9218_002093 [Villophora microphyllina]